MQPFRHRSGVVLAIATCAATIALGASAAAASKSATPRWGGVQQISGIATDGSAPFFVSCPAVGACAAAGDYNVGRVGQNGFVVSQKSGRWGRAVPVPGLSTLSQDGYAQVLALSCGSPGNCSVVGSYAAGPPPFPTSFAFIATETNGKWSNAQVAPGSASLGPAGLSVISCPSAGNCSAGGHYGNSEDAWKPFVIDEVRGVWQSATAVAGAASFVGSDLSSIACASAGNCSAGGGNFAVNEVNGTWHPAVAIPGWKALGGVSLLAISCPAAGDCSAGGITGGNSSSFVVSETNGTWGTAKRLVGRWHGGRSLQVNSIACTSAGNCVAGGKYPGFLATEKNGKWGEAAQPPGLAALSKNSGLTSVSAVSCPAAGSCSADGWYATSPPSPGLATPAVARTAKAAGGFVVDEADSKWQGVVTRLWDYTQFDVLACPSAVSCVAGGEDGYNYGDVFVSRTPG